ncbi:hypothetical protein [Cupriavidus necator]
MFECHAVFEAFEGLFQAPALVIEIAEGGGRMAAPVEQIGDEHAYLAGWRDLLDQPDGLWGSRTLIVARVIAGWSRERDDSLGAAGAGEVSHGVVRDTSRRALLFEMDNAIQALSQTGADSHATRQLIGCYHTLVRFWCET